MSESSWQPKPPHDCRITARRFRAAFGFKLEPPYDFSSFRTENSAIDTFFKRLRGDAHGGESGERIQGLRDRPVFSLHAGQMRGATWFDKTMPPEAVVWLCGFEPHDSRHKGRRDTYDKFAQQEAAGDFYPAPVDYKTLELSRRIRDVNWSTDRAISECEELLAAVIATGASEGSVCGIDLRLRRLLDDPLFVAVAVTQNPIAGELSGVSIDLTDERFLLVAAAMGAAAKRHHSGAQCEVPTHEFPGGLRNERAFEISAP